MPAFLKTKEDEERWARAKKRAEEEGHAGDWAYVTGIYKRMNGGKVAGGMVTRVAVRWMLSRG